MVQICEALTYIHSKDILHRDVTPDNVIVTPEQKIVLIDFGSARKFVDNKTQRQTTIVKPGYAPLEQHSATSRKGAYTDLYSVGAVFYYLLTGERPMDAMERVLERMKEPVEINPRIPNSINAIIMKAMEMDSSRRYQSASELIDDIFSDDNPESEQDIAQPSPKEMPAKIDSIGQSQQRLSRNTNQVIEAPKKQKRKAWPWMVSIGMLLAAAVVFWYFGKYKVTIEDVEGNANSIEVANKGESHRSKTKKEEEIKWEISENIDKARQLFESNKLTKYRSYEPMIGQLSQGWLNLLQAESLLQDLTQNEDVLAAKNSIFELREKYLEHVSSVYRDECANLVELKKSGSTNKNQKLIQESEVRVGQLDGFSGIEAVKVRLL